MVKFRNGDIFKPNVAIIVFYIYEKHVNQYQMLYERGRNSYSDTQFS